MLDGSSSPEESTKEYTQVIIKRHEEACDFMMKYMDKSWPIEITEDNFYFYIKSTVAAMAQSVAQSGKTNWDEEELKGLITLIKCMFDDVPAIVHTALSIAPDEKKPRIHDLIKLGHGILKSVKKDKGSEVPPQKKSVKKDKGSEVPPQKRRRNHAKRSPEDIAATQHKRAQLKIQNNGDILPNSKPQQQKTSAALAVYTDFSKGEPVIIEKKIRHFFKSHALSKWVADHVLPYFEREGIENKNPTINHEVSRSNMRDLIASLSDENVKTVLEALCEKDFGHDFNIIHRGKDNLVSFLSVIDNNIDPEIKVPPEFRKNENEFAKRIQELKAVETLSDLLTFITPEALLYQTLTTGKIPWLYIICDNECVIVGSSFDPRNTWPYVMNMAFDDENTISDQASPEKRETRPMAPENMPNLDIGEPAKPQGEAAKPQGKPAIPQGEPAIPQGEPALEPGKENALDEAASGERIPSGAKKAIKPQDACAFKGHPLQPRNVNHRDYHP